MMKLITGAPGNGKTLRALWEMSVEQERNAAAHALPVTDKKHEPLRTFWSNIEGSTRADNPNAFEWMQAIPADNDWRKLPDGAFIVYDEAHADGNTSGMEHYGLLFPSTGKPGESQDPRIRALSTARHAGKDLVFVTQWPSKIHHNVRSLLGSHTHMNRAMGLASAGVLSWSRVQIDPYDETQRDKAEEEIWSFPKDLYTRYKSATLHTSSHKFKFPKKFWSGVSMLVMFLLVAWGLWAYFSHGSKHQASVVTSPRATLAKLTHVSGASQGVAVTTTDPGEHPGTGEFASVEAPKVQGIMGCLDTPKHCRCWSRDGHLLDQTQEECSKLVAGGIPFDMVVSSAGSGDRGSRGEGVSPSAMGPSGPALPSEGTSTAEASVAGYGAMGHGPNAAPLQTAAGDISKNGAPR